MGVTSGKYAEVLVGSCNILHFESIEFTEGSEPQPYNARSGGGHTQTVDGVNSGEGTITGFFDPDDPIFAQITSGSTYTLTVRSRTSPGNIDATGTVRLGRISRSKNRDGTPQTVSIPFVTHSWTEYTG